MSLQSSDVLWLGCSTHNTHLVDFEERLEQITTADVKKSLDFIIAWVVPEALVVKVGLVKLDWGALIAHHELLEVEEAEVP